MRGRGLEPPSLAAQAPQACVFTNFTTRAHSRVNLPPISERRSLRKDWRGSRTLRGEDITNLPEISRVAPILIAQFFGFAKSCGIHKSVLCFGSEYFYLRGSTNFLADFFLRKITNKIKFGSPHFFGRA